MAQLFTKIKLYLGRDFSSEEVLLQDDRIDGVPNVYIREWNVEEVQPTEEQLNAFESQANELETANLVISNRKAEYPSIEDLVVALYDTEDKTAIDEKRAEIKLKYPKPGA